MKGDLEKVCLEISDSIVSMSTYIILRLDSNYIHPSLDLHSQLHDRLSRLGRIISFVAENQLLDSVRIIFY
jgi:hypothetical protein